MDTTRMLLKASRLEALTDGIYAIAMTILVLNLSLAAGLDDATLLATLRTNIFIKLAIYAGSFCILGSLWIGSNFIHSCLDRVDRTYLWLNLIYLMFICIIPFSANLMADYPHNPVGVYFYAVNLLCASIVQFIMWQFAHWFKLWSNEHEKEIFQIFNRRILIGPLLYIASIVVANWSIAGAFILLVSPLLMTFVPGKVDRFLTPDGKLF